MRTLASLQAEGVPREVLSDTPWTCHPEHSGLRLPFGKADAQYKPSHGLGLMQNRMLYRPCQTLNPYSRAQPMVHQHKAGGSSWGAFQLCPSPTSSLWLRRNAKLLPGLQNTRLHRV